MKKVSKTKYDFIKNDEIIDIISKLIKSRKNPLFNFK